jgi:hypothetical protein
MAVIPLFVVVVNRRKSCLISYIMVSAILLAWHMLAAVVCSAALPALHYTDTHSIPLPPSQDPFYTAPIGYENTKPGTILRIRLAPGNLTTVTGNCSSIHNILYRTTNSLNEASWAVTTLFTPASNSTLANALLSYQIPYNSADVDASPSYLMYNDTQRPSDIRAALGRGWYVNVPDFEGPLASFPLGVQEGHATLDSVRAVLSPGLGLSKDIRYALWGYSGGSVASEWAAELQVQYAPEPNFVGAALGGLVPNATSVFESITGTRWAGLIPSCLVGMTSQYPQAYNFLLSKLKTSGPYNKTMFLSVKDMNSDQAFTTFAGQNIFDYLEGGLAVYFTPILQKIIHTNGMMGYHGVPQMPLFMYKAIQDELSPIKDTDELVQRYCGVGANILYQRNSIGGHLAEYANGDAGAFAWLSSVFEGTDYSSLGCIIEDVALNTTDSPL